MLQLQQLSIQFHSRVLFSNFNLSVEGGEWVCLTGQSGCGKTSLLKAVLGFTPIAGGSVILDGVTLSATTVSLLRSKVAYVPQELFLPTEWVSEMVQLPLQLRCNRQREFNLSQLMDYWKALGLDSELYKKQVNKISGGQRQRMMLSVARMMDKKILLADEPTSALDEESVNKVILFFEQMKHEGWALLTVSHDARLMTHANRCVNLIND